jgi:hypothetical protein
VSPCVWRPLHHLTLQDTRLRFGSTSHMFVSEPPCFAHLMSVVLCRSGYSKNEDLTNSLSKSGCGTPEYVAPEVC